MNYEKIKTFFSKKSAHILILLAIFLIAFGIRAHILRYDLLFAFDSYWHARMNASFIQNPSLHIYDYLGTYHNALKQAAPLNFFWLLGFLIYKLFTFGSAYNKEIWIFFVRILPALYGAFTSLAMYLLFRYAYGKRSGYIAGFITAVMPAYVYRTMGGFYEEDSLGFLWLVLGFAFFIKALKTAFESKDMKKSYIYALISALFLSIMAFTWNVFAIVPSMLILYAFLVLIHKYFILKDDIRFIKFVKIFAIVFIVMALLSTALAGSNWIKININYGLGVLGLEKIGVNTQKTGTFQSKSVGEESKGWPTFGYKYNTFFYLGIISLILFLYYVYKNKEDYYAYLIFSLAIVTFYLAYNKLKATYWFGLGLSAFVSLGIYLGYKILYKVKSSKFIRISLIVLFAFFIFSGTAGGIIFVHNHKPMIDSGDGWKDAIFWIKENTPKNAKIINWWSQGHWITFLGERKVALDNTNSDGQALKDIPLFFIDDNVEQALGILKAYDADYLMISVDNILSLPVFYAYYKGNMDREADLYRANILPCKKTVFAYSCGSARIDSNTMQKIPFTWTDEPTDFYQGRIPLYYYRTPDNSYLFILFSKANKSMLAKIWFNSKELRDYFTLVYAKNSVRVYKINKDNFPKEIKPYMVGKSQEEIQKWNEKLKKLYGDNW